MAAQQKPTLTPYSGSAMRPNQFSSRKLLALMGQSSVRALNVIGTFITGISFGQNRWVDGGNQGKLFLPNTRKMFEPFKQHRKEEMLGGIAIFTAMRSIQFKHHDTQIE